MNTPPILFLLLLCGRPALGIVIGYSRLYNPSSHQTLDILYDAHVPCSLSSVDFQKLPVDDIKPHLYENERFVLEVFEAINSSPNAFNTAIIGESNGSDVCDTDAFIGYLNRLVSQRMRNITYIDADTIRRALYGKEMVRMPKGPKPSLKAWHDLYIRYVARNDLYRSRGKDFYKIADVEMLWHILTVPHQRIILYCGGLHASTIREFLLNHAGYREVQGYNVHMGNLIPVPLSALQPLAQWQQLGNGSQQ